ncbi:glutathione peroxidase [Panacibacter ginsenosidivorans]|uniref:Glutathione peroxidase n=1 Tax=Panacibacter ginsenosidivorans TaxID=1813871 RepID=A0A5B8VF38_9BACT|nr:glutathione peroxidase [Panacibacter ginsenosidivorans]QEC70197.1 glutathione peroxidase [Panacibacter ginsenosidivorans]
MTLRQSILKTFYPVLMAFGKSKNEQKNTTNMQPPVSFYSLHTTDNKGNSVNFEQFHGKKILLVNTASDCGYTPQYEDLEKLYRQYKDRLMIIAFPANDFGEQEKGNDEEVATFCKVNYGVTFPLMKKSIVVKGKDQNEIFQWLSDKSKNGWNDQEPTWNFCKYLVNENGVLTNFYNSSVSPMSKEVTDAINK